MYKIKIKSLRERYGITQEELSKIIGIERGLYSLYETEYSLIPMKHLNTICNYFKVSLDYVFELSSEKQYKNSLKDINKELSGKRLKEFRKEHKLTQNKLATFLNVSQSTIAEYERGTNIIATPFLYTICKKYSLSADYLLGKIDNH